MPTTPLRFRHRLLLLLLMVGIVVIGWLTRISPPEASTLNGRYVSGCCGAIDLKDGTLITRTERVPFKVGIDKWGVNMTPAIPIGVTGHAAVLATAAFQHIIMFDRARSSFIICDMERCGEGAEHAFQRMNH